MTTTDAALIEIQITDYLWGQVLPNQVKVHTHNKTRCEGQYCCIHNPSEHHMREWPKLLRMDKLSLMERTCPHGIGHPDPDSMNHLISEGHDWVGIHGCDGCCAPPRG